jgi:hypothetical protein
VQVPQKLSDDEREALEGFARTHRGEELRDDLVKQTKEG